MTRSPMFEHEEEQAAVEDDVEDHVGFGTRSSIARVYVGW